MRTHIKWTKEELEWLQKRLYKWTRKECAEYYRVSPQAITNVAKRYGLTIVKHTNDGRRDTRDSKGRFINPLYLDTPPRPDPFRRPNV